MANEELCVFCGQRPGTFRSTTVWCGNTLQPACKSCEKEVKDLDELALCQRALSRGLAVNAERLRERIALITEAEDHRPKCTGCGEKLVFRKEQSLDNSPMRDTIFREPFCVLPACCPVCGRYAFYDPMIVRRNKYLAYLISKDTQK